MNRNQGIEWTDIQTKLLSQQEKIWSLYQMEITGGEPDVIDYDSTLNKYLFYDFSAETPKERRSFCYDPKALESRKENKPKHSALGMAEEMGVEILNKNQYQELQKFGKFDSKTSSWLSTPKSIREAGGAIFGDFRYGEVFIYHNGAESYYAGRGFRALLKV